MIPPAKSLGRSLAFVVACLAATPAAAPPEPLTPERVLAVRRIVELRAAQDGARVAFTVIDPPKGDRRSKHVWMLDVKTHQARKFTNSGKSEWAPQWSPDGRRLAFLSDRDEKAQLWVMPADGGEAFRAAQEEADGEVLEWSPDGRRIAYVATEPKTEAAEKRDKEKDDARVVDRDDRPGRVFIVDVDARTSRLLSPAPWKVSEALWMPAGDRLIVAATDHPESDQWTNRIASLAVADGAMTPIASPAGPFAGLRLSPDGRSLAFLGSQDGGPEALDLFLLPLTGPAGAGGAAARNLTGESIDRAVEAFEWGRDGTIVALVETGFTSRLYRVTTEGKAKALAPLPLTATGFRILEQDGAAVPAGRRGAKRAATAEAVAFVGESAAEQPEIWLGGGGRTPERATSLNADWKETALARPEILRYRSFDGTEIEGALLKPAGGKAPLVVLAHGGPTGRWPDRFEAWGQLLAARGFAVFYPNVRGSTGYGARFVAMNRADWGGADFRDLMAGVDFLVARGVADPDRLGIGGWSYGGYMAMWAVTQTPRFKAAVAGAGLSNLVSEFGTENEPAYDEWFYGLPYEKPEGFLRSSPLTYAKSTRTPTLILQGEADVIDPIGQSQEFYRALKRYGVPSDFVLYPREGHGFQEEKHRLDVLTRVLAWFEKYLK